jgi:hypothetical protein
MPLMVQSCGSHPRLHRKISFWGLLVIVMMTTVAFDLFTRGVKRSLGRST